MTTLSDIAALVQEVIVIPEPEKIIDTRYPYTYSADFLRTHSEIIPAKYLDERDILDPSHISRADAAGIKSLWAADLGVDDRELACVFADGYLVENGIVK